MPGRTSGLEILTASASVISSGKPVRVYSATVVSGTTNGLILYNGTSTSGTAIISITGVANRSVTQEYGPEGILFPSGCYAFIESGASTAAIECSLEL